MKNIEFAGPKEKLDSPEEEKQKMLLLGCAGSLQDTLDILKENEFPEEEIWVVEQLLKLVRESSQTKSLPEKFLAKLKFATLAVLEMLFFDEMKDAESEEIPEIERIKSKYGREYPTGFEGFLKSEIDVNSKVGTIFLELSTLQGDMSVMVEAGKDPHMRVRVYVGSECDEPKRMKTDNMRFPFNIIEDISKLDEELSKREYQFFVIPQIFEEGEESKKITDIIEKHISDPNFTGAIAVGIRLTDKVGVMQVFEGNNVRLRSSFFTNTPLPKQEEALAMLEKGFSFVKLVHAKEGVLNSDKSQQQREPENSYDLEKKMDGCLDSLVFLEKSVSDRYYRRKSKAFLETEYEKKYLKNHERHYGKIFSLEGKEPDEILLTRSGVSANNLAIYALRKTMPDDAKAYFQQGWYYDNVPAIKKNFKMAENADNARLLFLNLDSCYPDDPEKFYSEQKTLLENFIKKAKSDIDNKYALVVDATVDLLWGEDLEIPENLIFAKTFSLTKHTRGSHNYFFGGIASWNSENLRRTMEKNMDRLGGRLMTTGIIHFPRLGRKEVGKNLEHVKKITQAFVRGFKEGQTIFPEDLRLKIYPYNFYTYVILPENFPRYPNFDEDELRLEDLAEAGDSFGLENTRVCHVPKSPATKEQAIRFSLGTKETEERAYKLGLKFNLGWREFVFKVKREVEEKEITFDPTVM